MELRVLNYFVHVIEEKNITRAAEKLHITQPTLSRQLKDLEQELGCILFERDSRKISPTLQGRLLFRRAKEMLEMAGLIQEELREGQEETAGIIRICAGDLPSFCKLAKLMDAFQEMYPAIQYLLYAGTALECAHKLENGLADLGLFLEPSGLENCLYLHFRNEDEWKAIVSVNHPLAKQTKVRAEELAEFPLIFPSRPAVADQLAHWFNLDKEQLHIAAWNNLPNLALSLIDHSERVLLSICSMYELIDPDLFHVLDLEPALKARSILAWKKTSQNTKAVQTFISFLSEQKDLFE